MAEFASPVDAMEAAISIQKKVCFAAEIGLSGEVRAISKIDERIAEAEKLGYEQIIISGYNKIVPFTIMKE